MRLRRPLNQLMMVVKIRSVVRTVPMVRIKHVVKKLKRRNIATLTAMETAVMIMAIHTVIKVAVMSTTTK
jgi:hypothetical protein